ncbi:hypothetical protein [Pararhodobacter sp.]|uniref:hypothetical protein n=1 Tax=Pararhodobacter sp. TaxID=2127056 RepID=UPI002FDD20D0
MLEHLPEDIRQGIAAAQRRSLRRGSRLCVHVNDAVFPVLRLWETGFAVDARRVPRLRGLVDIYDGPRHIRQCLIIASENDGNEMSYDFKRATVIAEDPVRDYADDSTPPSGYLPRPA